MIWDDTGYGLVKVMTLEEEAAWRMYCKDTAGSFDVRDFWEDLSPRVKAHYLNKVRSRGIQP